MLERRDRQHLSNLNALIQAARDGAARRANFNSMEAMEELSRDAKRQAVDIKKRAKLMLDELARFDKGLRDSFCELEKDKQL